MNDQSLANASQPPTLSIIIPWCNRFELETTLAKNHAIYASHSVEVIIVNCGGDVHWIDTLLHNLAHPQLRWVHCPASQFNKSLALNLGAHLARAPHLFFLDADILLQSDVLQKGLNTLDETSFVTISRVFESQPPQKQASGRLQELAYFIEFVTDRGTKIHLETNRIRFRKGSRSAPGLVFLKKQHFQQVGGMNTELEGWGWEDLDLLVRLQAVLDLHRRQAGSAIHLSHDDSVRAFGGATRSASQSKNFMLCLANYHLGLFQGTYAEDIKKWEKQLRLHTASH